MLYDWCYIYEFPSSYSPINTIFEKICSTYDQLLQKSLILIIYGTGLRTEPWSPSASILKNSSAPIKHFRNYVHMNYYLSSYLLNHVSKYFDVISGHPDTILSWKCSTSWTRNSRQKFWILTLRQAVRSIWNSCQYCNNQRASPQIAMMGQLPSCRIEPTIKPFARIDVD